MAAFDTSAARSADPLDPATAGPAAPAAARARRIVIAAFVLVAAAWGYRIGLPADPISMFFWLWMAAIAWRWAVPARDHLAFVRDWWPALATLLFYTYTRGLADELGIAPHERMPIVVDHWIGMGELPTQRLQDLLCDPTCNDPATGVWYDTVFTATYTTHFVFGFLIAIVLWLRSRDRWSHWMRRYLGLNLAGLTVYVLYPMVPPWMASDHGSFTPPIERLTGRGGSEAGLHLAGLVMGPIGNPVAAMPSLHAGTACLIALYGVSRLRSSWRWLLLLYPLTMGVGLVYFGEHYVIDIVAGCILAGLVMAGCRRWEQWTQHRRQHQRQGQPGASTPELAQIRS